MPIRRAKGNHPDVLWMRIARAALILLVLLLVLTPVTQSIWSGDNILQSGGDIEYTLALGLTFISLSLLLCWNRQSDFKQLIDCLQQVFARFLDALQPPQALSASRSLRTLLKCPEAESGSAGEFHVPLLI